MKAATIAIAISIAIVTAAVTLAAGCFNPQFQQGVPCTEDRVCPDGQICAEDDRCYDEDQVPDFVDNNLIDLLVSQGELVPPFDSATTEYELSLPLGVVDLVVTPTAAAPGEVTLELNGLPVESGAASPNVGLNLGSNSLAIVVTPNVGEPRTYTIAANRGAGILQQAYVKASNTGATDAFGVAIALDGDTLAVRAAGEDGGATGVGGDQIDDSASNAGAVYVFRRSGNSWSQEAYIKASNTDPFDAFGIAVALDGDTLAVGALREASAATGVDGNQADNAANGAGAVYVFRRIGTDWSQEAYIKASNTDADDAFGIAVALDGDTLAVGASGEDSAATGVGGDEADNDASNAGAVYIFRRSGASWSQEAYVKASNTEASDNFGADVALDGDILAVGARGESSSATGVGGDESDNSASASGAVYVFRRSGTNWTQETYIKASNPDVGDFFGGAIALDGDTLIVGAGREGSAATGIEGNQSDNNADGAGAVYVFRRDATNWSQEAYIKASNTNAEDIFGSAIALDRDILAVGARGEDSAATGVQGDEVSNAASTSGAVYLFTRSGSSWSQQAYIKASNTDRSDSFGVSVALDGDTVIVGAGEEDSIAIGINGDQADNSATGAGAVYIFQ